MLPIIGKALGLNKDRGDAGGDDETGKLDVAGPAAAAAAAGGSGLEGVDPSTVRDMGSVATVNAPGLERRTGGRWERQSHAHGGTMWGCGSAERYAATGSADRHVVVWDLNDGAPLVTWVAAGSTIYGVDVCGDYIVTGDGDGKCACWSIKQALAAAGIEENVPVEGGDKVEPVTIEASDALVCKMKGHTNDVNGVRFGTDDGQLCITSSTDDTMRVWDIHALVAGKTTTSECVIRGHGGTVWGAGVWGHSVYSGSTDRTVREWDWRTGESKGSKMEGHARWVLCVAVNERYIVSGDEDGVAKVWNRETHECLHTISHYGKDIGDIWAIAAGGDCFIAGSGRGDLYFTDYESGEVIRKERAHNSDVHDISIANNGRVVSCGGGSLTVYSPAVRVKAARA